MHDYLKRFLALLTLAAVVLFAQSGNLSIKSGVIDFGAAGSTQTVKKVANIAALPGTCNDGALAYVTAEAAGQQLYSCKSNAWTLIGAATVTITHSFTFNLGDGTNVIPTGATPKYPGSGPNSGTINRYDIEGQDSTGAACSMTADVWLATSAIPTSGNLISAAAPVTLSAATVNQNGSRTGWSNTVATNTLMGLSVVSAGTCVTALVQIYYQ